MQVEHMRAFIIKFVFYCIIAGLVFVAFKYVMPILMPFVLGFLFAFLLKPIISWVSEKSKLRRGPVAVFTLLVFYVLLATLFIVLGTRIVVLVRALLCWYAIFSTTCPHFIKACWSRRFFRYKIQSNALLSRSILTCSARLKPSAKALQKACPDL